jgi:hypothetical protein
VGSKKFLYEEQWILKEGYTNTIKKGMEWKVDWVGWELVRKLHGVKKNYGGGREEVMTLYRSALLVSKISNMSYKAWKR